MAYFAIFRPLWILYPGSGIDVSLIVSKYGSSVNVGYTEILQKDVARIVKRASLIYISISFYVTTITHTAKMHSPP